MTWLFIALVVVAIFGGIFLAFWRAQRECDRRNRDEKSLIHWEVR